MGTDRGGVEVSYARIKIIKGKNSRPIVARLSYASGAKLAEAEAGLGQRPGRHRGPVGRASVASPVERPAMCGKNGGRTVRIWCNRCGRKVERDALTLGLLLGREMPAGGLWRHLWCVECGARGKRQGDVFSMPEPAPLGPMGASNPKWKPMVM